MKLRCIPEDFQVEELTRIQPGKGDFAFYRLTKRSIGTPEAIAAILQRFRMHRRRLNYGGLKDRHAQTVQYLTIRGGPKKGFEQGSLNLEYLGQTKAAYSASDFDGNRFQLVMRDMDSQAIDRVIKSAETLATTGIPNFFDDQRFGSLGFSGDWIARAWCLGDYERALWLALADPHKNDSASEKQQKRILQNHWGEWPACKAALSRSHRRSIVTFLSDKVESGRSPDFRGAFARLKVDLRGLYLSAWQSAIWNRIVSTLIQQSTHDEETMTVPLLSGPAAFPLAASDALRRLSDIEVPLPSARISRPEGELGEIFDRVLEDEDMTLRQIRVKYPRDSFFSRQKRAAMIQPGELRTSVEPDVMHPRRKMATLSFCLPRGSYATILVKRLTH